MAFPLYRHISEYIGITSFYNIPSVSSYFPLYRFMGIICPIVQQNSILPMFFQPRSAPWELCNIKLLASHSLDIFIILNMSWGRDQRGKEIPGTKNSFEKMLCVGRPPD